MRQQRRSHNILVFLVLLLLVSPSAFGQQKRKRTTVNFEDQLIKGQNQKPDVLTIFKRKNLNHKRLIRLRENFLPEMRATANEIDEATKPKLRRRRKKNKE